MISRSPEITVAYQTSTQWGAVTIVEMRSPIEMLIKAIQVPYPSMTFTMGIWVPERRGERHSPNGDRFHQINWKDIVTGGCNHADRRHIQTNGITTASIPIRYDPNEYYKLLLGKGLLSRR